MKHFQNHSVFLTLLALLTATFSAYAAVQAPPLPVGSANVKIVAGQSPFEQERMQRAHKHHSPAHDKKDMTRDDTEGAGAASRRYGSDANSNAKSVK